MNKFIFLILAIGIVIFVPSVVLATGEADVKIVSPPSKATAGTTITVDVKMTNIGGTDDHKDTLRLVVVWDNSNWCDTDSLDSQEEFVYSICDPFQGTYKDMWEGKNFEDEVNLYGDGNGEKTYNIDISIPEEYDDKFYIVAFGYHVEASIEIFDEAVNKIVRITEPLPPGGCADTKCGTGNEADCACGAEATTTASELYCCAAANGGDGEVYANDTLCKNACSCSALGGAGAGCCPTDSPYCLRAFRISGAWDCVECCQSSSTNCTTTLFEYPPGIIAIENPLTAESFEKIFDGILDFIFKIGIVLAPVMIIVGGFLFVTAAGNLEQIDRAKKLILWTIIGFIIILLSKGLLAIIQQLLGVKGS